MLQKRRSDEFTEPRIAQIQADLRLLERSREVELLKWRADEDVYIENYAKRAGGCGAKGAEPHLSALQLVNIDRQAIYPRSAVKPKKIAIVPIG